MQLEGPDITIVIAVNNGGKTFTSCLTSIFKHRDEFVEVIVVDDASTDGSAAVAQYWGCRLISLGVRHGAYSARNLAIEQARGDILLFFDADQAMRAGYVQRVREIFDRDPNLTCAHGVFSWDAPVKSFAARYKNLTHSFRHRHLGGEACLFSAGLVAMSRSKFLQAGGFEEAEPLADIRFGYSLRAHRGRFLYDGEMKADHLKELTIWQLIVSDLRDRAVPWTDIVLDGKRAGDGVTRLCDLIPVALTLLIAPAALCRHWALVVLLILATILSRRRFHLYVAKRRGFFFALKSVVLDMLLCFVHGAGVTFAVLRRMAQYCGRLLSSRG